MPWSGSGVFNLTYNWPQDAANNIDINANRMQTQEQDLAGNGFGNTITRDGQGVPTANLPMAGFRHTNAQDGQALQDYATVNQVQMGLLEFVAAGGSSDAITAAYSPAVVSLADGLELRFTASAANTTTTPTYSPNSLAAHTITKFGGNPLAAGDIQNLQACTVRYNLANTRWELLTPANVLGGPFATLVTNTFTGNQTILGAGLSLTIQDDAGHLVVRNTAGSVVGWLSTVENWTGGGSDVADLAIGSGGTINFYTAGSSSAAATLSGAGALAAVGALSASNFSGASSGTNTGDQTITLSGVVTGSGTGAITTSFSGQINGSNAALTDAATVAWNVNTAQTATLTIAGNRTLALPTNLVAGGTYLIRITQGSGGSHTLAYASGYKWAGGTPPVLSTAAGAIDMISFSSDGTNMYGSNILKAFA